METVVQIVRSCLNNNGGHLQDIVFKQKLKNVLYCLQLTGRFYLSLFLRD